MKLIPCEIFYCYNKKLIIVKPLAGMLTMSYYLDMLKCQIGLCKWISSILANPITIANHFHNNYEKQNVKSQYPALTIVYNSRALMISLVVSCIMQFIYSVVCIIIIIPYRART